MTDDLSSTHKGPVRRTSQGKSYALTGGTGVAGSGTAGTQNDGCSGPASSTAQVCNTYIGISLTNSSGTSSAKAASASLSYLVTVDGYGTTTVTLNAASFIKDGTKWAGSGVTFC
ncbi:hypothetical protein [Dermacoccus nishinomiyaensis]|uniref:hypothetical protein n=1 Tax=Dermacoccus nishinomiyaensis TaxID=1274 RepID=UPI001F50CD07|nr:hypothetical protein [Dermacoccus nishinomiyaensis]MCI0153930.1 hypothetical protein [Dermacoccus nishinomiyaensis]